MPEIIALEGFAEEPFDDLVDVFGRLLAEQGGGASLAIYHHGRSVVDLVGGTHLDRSLQLVFSVSKLITAVAAAIAEQEGLLDLDQPIGTFWPSFSDGARSTITTRMVLSHRSGLPTVDQELSLSDLVAGRDEDALERQQLYWEPGQEHGYHAFTFGTFLQGIFRRSLGETVGEFVDRRMARPLGLDLWLGLPTERESDVAPIRYQDKRVSRPRSEILQSITLPPGSTARLAARTDIYNSPELRALGVPSSSGVASARSLARLLAAVLGDVDGVGLLDGQGRSAMTAEQSRGTDRMLGFPTAFGTGVQLPFPRFPLLGPASFGHEAAGGSATFADVESGIAVGFTTDRFPVEAGAGVGFLALLPTLQHCLATAATHER